MDINEYIIEKLKEISNVVKEISIKYAYDAFTNFHIIEVAPESIRRGNKIYMDYERSMWKDFRDKFPDEDIIISGLDETNDMNNLIYQRNNTSILKTELYDYKISKSYTDLKEMCIYLLAA